MPTRWEQITLHATKSKEEIFAEITNRNGVSVKTVWRAWNRWRKQIDGLPKGHYTVITSPKS
jgi:hypothetical protein